MGIVRNRKPQVANCVFELSRLLLQQPSHAVGHGVVGHILKHLLAGCQGLNIIAGPVRSLGGFQSNQYRVVLVHESRIGRFRGTLSLLQSTVIAKVQLVGDLLHVNQSEVANFAGGEPNPVGQTGSTNTPNDSWGQGHVNRVDPVGLDQLENEVPAPLNQNRLTPQFFQTVQHVYRRTGLVTLNTSVPMGFTVQCGAKHVQFSIDPVPRLIEVLNNATASQDGIDERTTHTRSAQFDRFDYRVWPHPKRLSANEDRICFGSQQAHSPSIFIRPDIEVVVRYCPYPTIQTHRGVRKNLHVFT